MGGVQPAGGPGASPARRLEGLAGHPRGNTRGKDQGAMRDRPVVVLSAGPQGSHRVKVVPVPNPPAGSTEGSWRLSTPHF